MQLKAEGAAMYRTAEALRDAMISLGVACDGGKDSLSMAASVNGEPVCLLSSSPVEARVLAWSWWSPPFFLGLMVADKTR